MPTPDDKRQQAEQLIRTAAAALLAGDIPPGGRCDISTLARQAGIGNAALTTRCAQQDQAITALQDLRTLTLSRLAAQHDEIQRLRAAARTGNVRALPPAPMDSPGTADRRRTHLDAGHRLASADTTTINRGTP